MSVSDNSDLTLDDVRRLLDGARAIGGPGGTTLELSILTLRMTWQVLAIKRQAIDWKRGLVRVPARGIRRTSTVALSSSALQVVLRVCGTAEGQGQVVSGDQGSPLRPRDVRLERLKGQLGLVRPELQQLPWTFRTLRDAGARELLRAGEKLPDIHELLGLTGLAGRPDHERLVTPVDGAVRIAERWGRILQASGGSPPAC